MKIPIPNEPTFIVPEGRYRAILEKVIDIDDKKQVRLVFAIISAGRNFVAGKNYPKSLAAGSALRNDLISWFGRDFTPEEIAAGFLDLNTHIGREADILLTHISNDRYENPFVSISKIMPAGSFVQLPATPMLAPAFG